MNYKINKVAVLGAGVMGAGIAAHVAGAGIPVMLLDIVPQELTDVEKAKGLTLESPEVRNRFAVNGKKNVLNPKARAIFDKNMGDLISVGNFEDDLHKINECDWVVEVIVENLDIKKNFMKELQKHYKPGAILSSNTSGVSINKIVEEMPLEIRENFLGTHFFNPPRYMKLFELIPGNDTKPELMEFMENFGTHRLGKGVVLAKDTQNFIGNRIGTFSIVNTLQLMEKHQLNVATVDALTGPVIGRPKSATFRTIDMVGLDIFKNVASNFAKTTRDEQEIKDHEIPVWIDKLIQNGQLGNKTKQGVYKVVRKPQKAYFVWDKDKEEYEPFEKAKLEIVSKAFKAENRFKTLISEDSKEGHFVWDVLKNVILYSAKRIPEITEDFKRIDNAMKWGYNWEYGPFEIWDMIGVKESIERMKSEGEDIPAWVTDYVEAGNEMFYEKEKMELPYISLDKAPVIKANKDAELLDIGDGIACLRFNTKGNSVTEGVMDMMLEAVKEVEENYKGLVVGNQGGNFSVGANLMLIAQFIQSGNWDGLKATIDKFQSACQALKYCKKPVVSAPYGMTLGGGAEIVLHTHSVVAAAETYMGLVEVGVGLLPGGGGNKELLIRAMEGLGKVNNGEMLSHLKKTWETIATAKVSSSAHDAMNLGFLRKSDTIVMNGDYLVDHAKSTALKMSENFVPLKDENIKVLGTTGIAHLMYIAEFMVQGSFISEHDKVIAKKIAEVLSGGQIAAGNYVAEQQLLDIEREAFVTLCREEKTQARIENMLKTGKPLRN